MQNKLGKLTDWILTILKPISSKVSAQTQFGDHQSSPSSMKRHKISFQSMLKVRYGQMVKKHAKSWFMKRFGF